MGHIQRRCVRHHGLYRRPPRGDQILLAAGSSVEPFWVLYGMHKTAQVLEILERYRIGNLRKEDVGQMSEDMSDPYSNDPIRHAALKPASKKPFNAECPLAILVQSFITPNELFYVRNHLPVPNVDTETYELEVEIEGTNKTATFTLDELKKFPKHTITATIMCAGNRRGDMMKVKPVKGLNWGPAAIGNATWTGVRLRDVLLKAGLDEDDTSYNHVQFEGVDIDVTGKMYAASIPIWKALDREGRRPASVRNEWGAYPQRPRLSYTGYSSGSGGGEKRKVTVSKVESDSHWQQFDYKGFAPCVDYDSVDFSKSPAIQELPIISAICVPSENETVQVSEGHILVKGYAWSGGGQKIVRVDVTADKGEKLACCQFRCAGYGIAASALVLDPVVEIWAKAVDSCYNTQPERVEHIWNFRGVLSNAYHRVTVHLKR
ncbi:hypothetical protein NQ318_012401 [Aromia moschata]|uniref:Sulfite oxidase n=1 Tax=Aromia moschata TaxID=1265417 RepID=A0AAV8Y4X7_9CUCU|nr:hypothetical protein NQ318_012401 [Aromia moschata]